MNMKKKKQDMEKEEEDGLSFGYLFSLLLQDIRGRKNLTTTH